MVADDAYLFGKLLVDFVAFGIWLILGPLLKSPVLLGGEEISGLLDRR